jgi:hypothetical protein
LLAQPGVRVDDLGLDRMEDLRDQPKQPTVRCLVTGGPVAVELRLVRFGDHVEAAPSRPSEVARAPLGAVVPRRRGARIHPEAPAGDAGVRFEAGQDPIRGLPPESPPVAGADKLPVEALAVGETHHGQKAAVAVAVRRLDGSQPPERERRCAS